MKVLLITSQYYYSRHSFIVEYDEGTFQQQAIECVKELEKYKRQADDTREFNLGDLDNKWFKESRTRCNVNDAGDIYFEVCNSINKATHYISEYQEQSRIGQRGYQPKRIINAIEEHHQYRIIKDIVAKHFIFI